MSVEEKTPRGPRTTRAQFEIYLEELRVNKNFRENKFTGIDPDLISNTWDKLKTVLNASGGPSHDVAGWKRVFTDWKSQVRAKARKIRATEKETGNIGTPIKHLTDLEDQLLNITGKVVVTGMEGVPEIGIGDAITQKAKKEVNENTAVRECNNNLPSTSSERTLAKKRKFTLRSRLEEALEKSDKDKNLYGEVTKIRETLEKMLQLKRMKLSVQYPEHYFQLSDGESSE